jgi:hypothetical protein
VKLCIARVVVAFLLVASATPLTFAQTSTQTTSALPRLVRFGGTAKDLNGSPMTGVVGITFALYSEQNGGSPLWLETQNATADSNGHYSVLLGSTKPEGLPAELFTSEQARWVGVQVSGQAEQPRVLLVSAPYALKAGDAETIGGLPPSAFVLAAPLAIGSSTSSSTAATVPPPAATDVTTTGGTLNYLPMFSGAATIVDSAVFQTGSGTTAKVGINTTTPVTQLDVNGAGNIRGTLSLPATSLATAAGGKNSQGLNLVASSFSSTSSTAVNQVFRWQAEPAANDTTAPSGTLNLQYGLGATAPSETGLKLSNKGILTFAPGQTFPGTGTGDGSVTSIATGLGLTGGPITKTGTISINTTVVPQLSVANTFSANQTVNGAITVNSSGTTITANTKAIGVLGITNGRSSTSALFHGTPGVWGDTGGAAESGFVGVVGTADNNSAGNFFNNSTVDATLILGNDSTSLTAPVLIAQGNSASNNSSAIPKCIIDGGGDLTCSGTVTAASLTGSGAGLTNVALLVAANTLSANQTANGTLFANSPSSAVIATSTSSVLAAIAGAGPAIGVFGTTSSTTGIGALGITNGRSSTSTLFGGSPGVWGDTGGAAESGFVGVVGTADNNSAGNFFNNSAVDATLFVGNNSTTSTAPVLIVKGDNTGDSCTINVSGTITCNGTVVTAVSANSGARKVALYSVQSPENWFEDFGSGALTNGAATITLDPAFTQTVNTGTEYHVFLTPNGDSKGLYVSQKTATSFEVREQGGGISNVAFDYRIVAKRVGYEKVRLADVTERFNQQEAPSRNMRPARSSAEARSGSQIPTPPPAPPVVEHQLAPKMRVLPVLPSAAPRPAPVRPS